MLAGIAIGLLFYKPQLGVAVFVLMIARREWRVLMAAGATVLAQAVACWLWFGTRVMLQYVDVLQSLPRVASLLEPSASQTASLRGFFMFLGMPSLWSTVLYVAAAVLVSVGMVQVWRHHSYEIAFPALLIATILVAPHATVYDLVLLAPALILLSKAAAGTSRPEQWWPVLGAAYLLPVSGPIVSAIHLQLASPVLALMLWKIMTLPAQAKSSSTKYAMAPR
jgi:hypothetical protein